MIYEEKTVSSEKVFEGRIIKVKVDRVEMPDGSVATRELVEHPGGVGIVAITDKDEIILVEQYRKPLDKAIYEIPAGKLDPGEHHRTCGIRELEEETGLSAKVFDYMGFIYPSPGFTDEVTHVYLAKELTQGETHPDDDEFLDVKKVPFDTALKMVMDGEINDAKSVFGILKYNMMR
ncbi:MAG: NUDIX hydrolase [Clostridiales bacterium]|nr:NUDIX hydrolase [Clostridiales bacterium]MBD9010619.1 NUDIX hydrolase [Clostridiales bacterium]